MSFFLRTAVIGLLVVLSGCAGHQSSTKNSESQPASTNKSVDSTMVKDQSNDDETDGEIIGTPAKNSKFAKLKIGLSFRQVTDLIGGPDDLNRYQTGKRWIPFYFGSDAQRYETLYKGEGCLTYTGGNAFGGGGDELIRITVDTKGACMGG